MSTLAGKHILLIISGGIAAYKTLDLIRRLRERGASVKPVLTRAAKQFVTPLSVASLSGSTVYDELFSLTEEVEMGHIQLSRASDLVVVAPATADLLAKAANGLADDLASTLLLATDKKPIFVPAMNVRMWLHSATQRNVAALKSAGCPIIGPADGEMACGEFGPGRMIEPLEIVAALEQLVSDGGLKAQPLPSAPTFRPLAGRRAIVTAGPTREALDPVRYISNKSSGKQGYAIAEALAAAGAETVLVSGPVDLKASPGIALHRVVELGRHSNGEFLLRACCDSAAAFRRDSLTVGCRDGGTDHRRYTKPIIDVIEIGIGNIEGGDRAEVGFAHQAAPCKVCSVRWL